jgi:uncharacterized protein YbjT (DUF2867 family)
MTNKVLVLGAGGVLGVTLIQELIKHTQELDAYAGVQADDLAEFPIGRVKGVEADLDNPATLLSAVTGKDIVLISVPMDERMRARAARAIGACKDAGVKFILWSSFINSAPDSDDMALREYGLIDDMVRKSGIDYCIFHPNSYMQTFTRYYVDRINSDGELYSFQDRRDKTSYIDIRDAAAAYIPIFKDPLPHRCREYTLTGPAALSNDEVVQALSCAAERTIVYIEETVKKYLYAKQEEGLSDWKIAAHTSINDHVIAGKQSVLTVDAFALTRVPLVAFERFAREYAHVWRQTPLKRVGMHRFPRNI